MLCFICWCLEKGLLAKRLMIAMRTELNMAWRVQLLHCRKVGIVSFLPKILGRNQDFSKGSVCGGSHFSN